MLNIRTCVYAWQRGPELKDTHSDTTIRSHRDTHSLSLSLTHMHPYTHILLHTCTYAHTHHSLSHTTLTHLDLYGCSHVFIYLHVAINNMPDSICELQELEVFDMSSNPITALCDGLVELKQLRVLILNDCQLEELPPNIGK